MKIAPPSTDLIIKLAIGVAVLGVGYWAVRKGLDGIKEGFDAITSAPERAWDWVADAVTETAQEVGGGFLEQYKERTPEMQKATNKKYEGPLINDDGMDFSPFGGLSG